MSAALSSKATIVAVGSSLVPRNFLWPCSCSFASARVCLIPRTSGVPSSTRAIASTT